MDPADPLLRVAHAALPAFAKCARENFAGDPLVRKFFDWAKTQLGVDPVVLVTWRCPPEVLVLDLGYQPILVRSERFDTLLVEYMALRKYAVQRGLDESEGAVRHAILRWTSEFFLGFRNALLGASALARSHEALHARLRQPAVRDESLASLPDALRAAVQCFCLGHEMAHLTQGDGAEAGLATLVDGISLQTHIKRDLGEAKLTEAAVEQLLVLASEIDAKALLQEIDADLISLELVMVFLTDHFEISLDEAVEAAVMAFEAQCYLYALKHSCQLIHQAYQAPREPGSLRRGDWRLACETGIRARCVLRRAGIILAKWSDPQGRISAARVNSLVPLVDAMFLSSAEFREALSRFTQTVFDSFESQIRVVSPDERRASFEHLLARFESDEEIRLDLFYLLISMGYTGATNGVRLLQEMFDSR